MNNLARFLVTIALAATCHKVAAAQFHVAPNGNDERKRCQESLLTR